MPFIYLGSRKILNLLMREDLLKFIEMWLFSRKANLSNQQLSRGHSLRTGKKKGVSSELQ